MARRRRKNRKALKIVLFLVLLIAAGVICFLVWQSYFSGDNGDVKESVEDTSIEEETRVTKKVESKEDPVKEAEEEVVVEKDKVVQYEGENPNKQDDLTGVVTYAGVNDEVLMVRVNIDQYISGGSCNLVLRRGGADVYGATAEIVASVATSTCDGFDIPVSSVGAGSYEIVINLNSNGKAGTIRGEVNI